MGAWLFFIYRVFMADETILKEIKNVVNNFGWDVNLTNGFWVKLQDINPKNPIAFDISKPIYCNSVTLPSVNIEYEEVSVSVNKFKTQVPMAKVKTDLSLEVTGGTADYIKNITNLFKSQINAKGTLNIGSLFEITVWTFSANYDNVAKINYKNCYLKSIGEVTFEQSATNSFFKCTYMFTVGRIDSV